MKRPLPILLSLLTSAGSLFAGNPVMPNFIVILGEGAGWASTSVQMDDRNPGSRGRGVETPQLERLAASGIRFSDGYAASPRCTPSRAALFTGRSPAALHMTFVGDGRGGGRDSGSRVVTPQAVLELASVTTTIAEYLKQGHYATAHFGKWHVGRVDPSAHGFEESDGPTGNGGPDNVANPNPKQALGMTERGIQFMERQTTLRRPFYLQMSHYPSQDERGGGGRGRGRSSDLNNEEVSTVDRTVGQILDAVEKLGLRGNTYVVYTTDHGTPGRNPPLAGGKGTIWDGGLRVPFLIAGPGIQPGRCSHVRVTAMDLFPTFAELSGLKLPLPAEMEGGSIARLLVNPAVSLVSRPRDLFVVHFPHYDKDEQGPASAAFLNDYKLIRVYATGERRLYNIASDPSERNDLSRAKPETVSDMDRRLTEYLSAVHAQMPGINTNAAVESRPAERKGGRRRSQTQPNESR